jgi:hypothetical protein
MCTFSPENGKVKSGSKSPFRSVHWIATCDSFHLDSGSRTEPPTWTHPTLEFEELKPPLCFRFICNETVEQHCEVEIQLFEACFKVEKRRVDFTDWWVLVLTHTGTGSSNSRLDLQVKFGILFPEVQDPFYFFFPGRSESLLTHVLATAPLHSQVIVLQEPRDTLL